MIRSYSVPSLAPICGKSSCMSCQAACMHGHMGCSSSKHAELPGWAAPWLGLTEGHISAWSGHVTVWGMPGCKQQAHGVCLYTSSGRSSRLAFPSSPLTRTLTGACSPLISSRTLFMRHDTTRCGNARVNIEPSSSSIVVLRLPPLPCPRASIRPDRGCRGKQQKCGGGTRSYNGY